MNYYGYPVFNIRPSYLTPLTIANSTSVSDFGLEYTSFERKILGDTRQMFSFFFIQRDAAERKLIRDFFETAKGKYGKFWLPTFNRDFKLSRANTTTQIWVENADYYTYLSDVINRYIIKLVDNNDECAYITDYSDISATESLVSVDNITAALPLNTYISFLYFARFNQDSLLFETIENDITQCQLSFMELSISEFV